MPQITVTWTPICGKYDQNEDIQRFLRESALSPSQSNPDMKLRVDHAGKSGTPKRKVGRPSKNAPPSAAGAAGPSGSAASSSDQGSAAAASSQQDSTSGGGAPPAQSSMPPPETDRTDCAGADQSSDSGLGAAHAATAQDGAGATANAASPRGPVQSAHSLNRRPRVSLKIRLQKSQERATVAEAELQESTRSNK